MVTKLKQKLFATQQKMAYVNLSIIQEKLEPCAFSSLVGAQIATLTQASPIHVLVLVHIVVISGDRTSGVFDDLLILIGKQELDCFRATNFVFVIGNFYVRLRLAIVMIDLNVNNLVSH
eukprot:TRINITY_DN4319_c0_g1_i5.p3 TRINITY_DN4319_c0_g1~~TRINITY_DN4319_c0_g1_i5.p3  ORF type:complete len:119 (-),score=4.56 TRINITY_DN4319_c0_g1_i5:23-379(-)